MNPLIRATLVGEARRIDTGSRGSQLPSNAVINLIHLLLLPSVVDVASVRSAVSAKDTRTTNGRSPSNVRGLLEICNNHVLSVSDATQARVNQHTSTHTHALFRVQNPAALTWVHV